MPEVKYVEGSDEYYITSDGELYKRIFSYEGYIYHDTLVKPTAIGEYPYWNISFNNTWQTIPCHILVAQYFVPNPNNFPVVHHKDNDKFNWHPDNLEWVTQQENVIRAIQDGLTNATPLETVKVICQMICNDMSNKDIADRTGVHHSTVCAIRHKRRWKHVSDNYF